MADSSDSASSGEGSESQDKSQDSSVSVSSIASPSASANESESAANDGDKAPADSAGEDQHAEHACEDFEFETVDLREDHADRTTRSIQKQATSMCSKLEVLKIKLKQLKHCFAAADIHFDLCHMLISFSGLSGSENAAA